MIDPAATLTVTDPVLQDFADQVGETEPIAVEGRRTRWALGGEPRDDVRLISAPPGIVDYVPEEMIVRVRAGTTVADLHAALAEKGQRSALPDRGGTVGGAIVVGENDIRMLGVGRLRAAVLQVRYVSAEGRMISGGGPTVKNVSGFDLPRLMVGSLGTLGLIAEVILRTNPIPAVSQWLVADGVDPFDARDAVLAPSATLWDGNRTWVLLEGHGPDVEAERRMLGSVGAFRETDAPPPMPAERWSLSPSQTRQVDREQTGAFIAEVGTGLLLAERPQARASAATPLQAVADRMKSLFDPTGRLNPGRRPQGS